MESLETQLTKLGMAAPLAQRIVQQLNKDKTATPEQRWQHLLTLLQTTPTLPFAIHQLLYTTVYPEWNKIPAPAWFPDPKTIQQSHIKQLMQEKGFSTYEQLHQWSVKEYANFWQTLTTRLNIKFDTPYSTLVDISAGVESPRWFKDATLNIVNSCFNHNPSTPAIIYQSEQGELQTMSYVELQQLVQRIASSLKQTLQPGDRVAIIMPMDPYAVATYLGAIMAGCCVVSIPDSFAAEEIEKRLVIAKVKMVFTQDVILRDGKRLPLYDRILKAHAPVTVVIPVNATAQVLRQEDKVWQDFLSANADFTPLACQPDDYINILFSSGTTGAPKAIPWTHTTPIKCMSDAYLHHDLHPGDIFCWPTNLGWMMGPWLIFACLGNQATIALFDGVPNGKKFGQFIQDAKVTHLGVVPTIVKSWRSSQCMEDLDWSHIKLFTSTGETSNVEDMQYLMALVNYRPIIEYCGGTEIGGAYITATLIHPCAPSAFTTSALGLDFIIIDEQGKPSDYGEVALIPPSIGLSTTLANKDHHEVYYADMPTYKDKILRRHGDQIQHFANGFYRLHGRADDTMKLSGIKISANEIEAVLHLFAPVYETAAIAVEPSAGGPSQLIVFAIPLSNAKDNINMLKQEIQNVIKEHLNPLFKVHDVVIVDILPRTASNKIMRRKLKDQYAKGDHP